MYGFVCLYVHICGGCIDTCTHTCTSKQTHAHIQEPKKKGYTVLHSEAPAGKDMDIKLAPLQIRTFLLKYA